MTKKRKEDPFESVADFNPGPERNLVLPDFPGRPQPRKGYEHLDEAIVTIRESVLDGPDRGYLKALDIVTRETEKLIEENARLRLKESREKARKSKKAGRR